ncbi:Protein kinase [Lunasporangiospora selenospora]|uniref:Protein kinase n=1 Tax=Lunasporangiospora selenospora TaxID=979761 RepID=A0A9P6G1N8_9FUNG|nr:Protein kinase [Lunasporangiospora selenospora]
MLLSMSASLYPDQGTQAESGAADGLDILEAPLLTLNGLAQPTLNARCEGEGLSSLSSSSSSSGLRVVYPGLRNTIGPYKLIRLLGRGSYSEVQLAADTRTGVHVAIKIMNKSMIQSSDRLGTSVRRESELLKMIRHPNIIRFREVVETSAQTCIVLDYASGGELYNYVSEKRAQAKEEDIQTIFAQITDDILLESRAQYPLRPKTKLTDFGLAKVIDSQTPLLTTRCGSEDYAAPEIILGQPYEGSQADVWSLGVILYALLIGFLPFNRQVGMTRKMFLNMIARAEFGFPGEVVMTSKRASMLDLYSVSLAAGSGSTSAQCIASLSPGSGSRSTMTGMETLAVESCSSASLANTGHRVGESCSSVESSGKDMINTPVSATPSETDLPPPPQATNYMTFKVPKMNGVQAVSEESMALVRRILQPQGVKRPSARELLHLDWVSTGQRILADM